MGCFCAAKSLAIKLGLKAAMPQLGDDGEINTLTSFIIMIIIKAG